MAYFVKDAYGSTIGVESSVVSGTSERQAIAIASFLTAVPTTPTGNQSVSGTVVLGGGQSSVSGVGIFTINPLGNGSIIAHLTHSSVAALQGTNPWNVSNSSVMLTQGTNTIGSVATVQGTNPWLVGNSSVMLTPGTETIGSVATLQGTNPWVISNSSVYLTPGIGVLGSVATLQGTNPWVVGNSSVMLTPGINAIGSVATLQGTTPWITTIQDSSIAGTYAEDTGHVDGQRGIFVLGVRNDAVASFASANLDYTPKAVDSAGRTIVKPFAADQARVFSVIATNNTTSTSLLAAGGAGLRTYVTDAFVTNTAATATLVSFTDGDNSVIGRTIAPATGGSNMVGLATPMRTGGFAQTVNITMATAVSTLGVTALGYYAP